VTFFVDRDLGPLVGKALRAVKVEVVLHHERFGPMEKDTAWIASVSREGLVILTRDRKIRSRPGERAVFEAAGARSFVVTTGASTPLDDLRALLAAWPRIQDRIENQPGPFMYGISRDGRMTQFIPTEGPAGPAARRNRIRAPTKTGG
jgi:hypothetical protein